MYLAAKWEPKAKFVKTSKAPSSEQQHSRGALAGNKTTLVERGSSAWFVGFKAEGEQLQVANKF